MTYFQNPPKSKEVKDLLPSSGKVPEPDDKLPSPIDLTQVALFQANTNKTRSSFCPGGSALIWISTKHLHEDHFHGIAIPLGEFHLFEC